MPSTADRISAVSRLFDDGAVGPQDRQMLAFVDAVLTAAAVGPERTYPHEWMRLLCRDQAFASPYLEQASVALLSLSYNKILEELREMRSDYAPRFLDFAESGEEIELAGHWAAGFVEGMQLRGDAWEPLIQSKEARPLLAPIFLYLTRPDGTSPVLTQSAEEIAELRREALDLIGPVVHGISQYWKEQRRRSRPTPVELSRKIGRNEPCPCGSGKKHKKCCLQRAA